MNFVSFALLYIKSVMHIPYFEQEEVGEHGFKSKAFFIFRQSDLSRHDVEILRRASSECIVPHLRDGNDGYSLEIELIRELYDTLGFSR